MIQSEMPRIGFVLSPGETCFGYRAGGKCNSSAKEAGKTYFETGSSCVRGGRTEGYKITTSRRIPMIDGPMIDDVKRGREDQGGS